MYNLLKYGVSALVLACMTLGPALAQSVTFTGDVSPTDAGSDWNLGGSELSVGGNGAGTLTIEDGGTVTNTWGFIGLNAGSNGTVMVSGEGSTWASSGALLAGYLGSGTLTVEDGGTVTSALGYIGDNAGSNGTVTVSGEGSTWANTGLLYVGRGNLGAGSGPASGVLTIEDEGSVSATRVTIGIEAGATGALNLNGTSGARGVLETGYVAKGDGAASFTFDGGILRATGGQADFLRNFDAGDVTIDTGGAFVDSNGFNIGIATDLQGTGGLSKTGAGTLTLTGDSNYAGDTTINGGMLEIADGGTVANAWGYIGYDSGSNGTATVSGAGSKWTNTEALYAGVSGHGALTIEDGGSAANTVGYIGRFGSSTGIVTVTGDGSTWTNHGELLVGAFGDGTLTISDGGMVSNTQGSIGHFEDSTGAATVTDAGSIWTSSTTLFVGLYGDGTLTISNGGAVTNTVGYIGRNEGSIGEATVTGAGSTWMNSGDLHVGVDGIGTLSIEDGGAVTNTVGYIGRNEGSIGEATVTGAGSTWMNSGDLYVGIGGIGTLSIEDGGAVSNGWGYLGYALGSTGVVAVTGAGSTWTNSAAFYVGVSGDGALSVADGGAVDSMGGHIALNSGSTGAVVVTGAGSTWKNDGELAVGFSGEGNLTIEDGGSVSDVFGYIGRDSGSTGVARVAGKGSTWTSSGDLIVGSEGDGTLTIEDGGSVSDVSGSIAFLGGSVGSVLVAGADSTWTNTGEFAVGVTGDGMLSIEDGGSVSNTNALIAYSSGSTGSVAVTGSGSAWENVGELFVGFSGDGTLTIADSGTVEVNGALTIAQASGSTGTLNIGAAADDAAVAPGILDTASLTFGDGAGTLVFNHTATSGDGFTFAADLVSDGTGTHAIEHLAGVTDFTGDGWGFTGTTNVTGGSLYVNGALGSTMNVRAGGTLGGSGTVGTTTVADGGILSPGSSIGTLTVDGDLALSSGSVLNYELGGLGSSATSPGTSDRIDVTGDLALNGTLNLSQSGDAADGASGFGYYRLMTYGGTLSGDGLTIGDTPALSDPAGYEIQTGGGDVDLFIVAVGDDTLQHWQGGDGVWNAANAQWLNQGGELPVAWAGNHGVFRNEPGGLAGGTITVEGTQAFAGLQFVDEGYRLEGGGALRTEAGGSEIRVLADSAEIATAITGIGGIVKTQAGTLILSGQNSHEGGTTIAGGTVQVAEDANLGAASGGLTFTGGTLSTTVSFDSARAVTLDAAGRFDVAGSTTLGLTGTIGGAGNLVKLGAGTLVLEGANAYGDTLVGAGTLVGDADAISGNIGNAGTVIFDQAGDASFSGDIAGLGGTDGTMVKQGAGTLTLTGTSSLDWSVDNGGLTTAAERFTGNADIGRDGTLTFDQAADATYAGVISGQGALAVAGSGSMLLTGDSSGFAGTTSIAGATLLVDNVLGGTVTIDAGGTLGGSGTVGTTTVADDGILSPGNSIGTLTVNGNLNFEAGSRLAIEVNPQGTDSDLVHATGNVTLNGGSVAHIGANGTYDLRSTYTILSADGTLSGTFDDVTSDFAFLTPGLIYDYGAGTIGLELARNESGFASAALTRNQIATANGIESIGFDVGNPVYDAIAQLPNDTDLVRASFDALSGEIHASAKSALIEDSHFVRDAATERVRAAFGGVGISTNLVLVHGEGGPTWAQAETDRFAAWGQAFGSWGGFDSDSNAAGLDISSGGFLMGADAPFGDWRLGLMAGHSHTSFHADDRASSGSSDNYHLGLYAGTQVDNLGFRTGLAYTWHDIETGRSVAIPGSSNRLSGGYDAGTFQAFGEFGHRIDTPFLAFEPFANLAYVSLHTDGFTENGGAAALTASDQTTDTVFTTLGFRASTGFSLGAINATARGMLGWRHAFGDTPPSSTQAFAGSDVFTVAGVPIARDAAITEAGIDLDLTGTATLGLSYQGQFGDGVRQSGFSARFKVGF